ncbi:caspase domain-containing protein [Coprinopsis sp. MPI-PUGE-AT-0042]|nr:caspase domain-containing protein [Coprinopsis sp. MPI-PUGE-AT-0042]
MLKDLRSIPSPERRPRPSPTMHVEPAFDALNSIKGKPVKLPSFRKAQIALDIGIKSPPTGQRALLIAMNYSSTLWAKTPHALLQPQHDVQLMKEYLLKSAGWSESEITVLTDARKTAPQLLPTHANIMREIKALADSNCQNAFFLYTGHSDQRPQPKQSTQPQEAPRSAPGRRVVEKFDQYIIPIDAIIGPELQDVDPDLIILDDVLHECLISTRPARSTFLAVLDTCHSATLFDLKHHRCNRIRTVTSLFRRAVRKVVVEPLWTVFGKAAGGVVNMNSFNVSHFCNGLCPRRKTPICPIAVTISACKDRQQVYENGRSLTETIVELLRSKPTACLRDVIDAVLDNYKMQQKLMKDMEKRYKKAGDSVKRQEMYETRREAKRLRPQVASTGALDLSRSHTWLAGLTRRSDD